MYISQRLRNLPTYAFAAVDSARKALVEQGVDVIDFGVGDHTIAAPAVARERLKVAVEEFATAGYPSYVGSLAFREAVAAWNKRRFGVRLDPQTEICSTVGSKEGVFHLPLAFVDPGDVVLVPSPGYPPYERGTTFAGGVAHPLPLLAANDFLIDFDAIPADVAVKARLLWLCYPNSPTGKQADRAFFERAYAWCRAHDVLLVSDEAYTEIYFDEASRPVSALEVGREGVLVVQSMSKRSMMTGWRIGWVCGDPDAVAAFKALKTNIDSGTPDFVQAGAIAALADESHVKAMREETKRKRDLLVAALVEAGLAHCAPDATLYLWQRVPEGTSGVAFAQRLLAPEIAIVCTPGEWISTPLADGSNPGRDYVRFALVPPVGRVEEAANRLRSVRLA